MKNPGAIVDQVQQLVDQLPMVASKARNDVRQQSTLDMHEDLAASLGGEFSLSLDGPPFPVPSWKLVTEVYDPERIKATLHKLVAAHDELAARNGGKPLRTGEETVDGQTYYLMASNDPPNPLTEVHYTFSDGYMIAAPTRAMLTRALQIKSAGTSITHSAQFVAMTPRDRFTNFSAVIYQNLGTTLAPLVGLLGAFAPNAGPASTAALQAPGQHEAHHDRRLRRAGSHLDRRHGRCPGQRHHQPARRQSDGRGGQRDSVRPIPGNNASSTCV